MQIKGEWPGDLHGWRVIMAKKSVAGTVGDPTIVFTPLVIDDHKYQLAFSFNAIAEAESKAGCNLLRGIKDYNDLSVTQLRGLLYAALTVSLPDITLEEAGNLLRLDTMND